MSAFARPLAEATTTAGGKSEAGLPRRPGLDVLHPAHAGVKGLAARYFALVPNVVQTVWPLDSTVSVTLYVAVLSESDLVARL